MYRSQSHETMNKLANFSSIPIINGLSDFSHPCQAMADLMTIYEKKYELKAVKINWIGPITNVARSWIEIANLNLGISLNIFTNDYSINEYHKKCEIYNLNPDLENIEVHKNLKKLDKADVLITDTWESMGEKVDEKIIKDFSPYTVNREMMIKSGDECIFMHCLPANRGQEVASEVIDGPQSVVWDEAQNRLHIQKEILKWCL
jgi:ornithine carbamoyltransferase